MVKEMRDISLTIGTIGIVTVLGLFLCTLVTSLKLGKISLIICAASIALVLIGLSQKNRARLKNICTNKALT